jgi:pimeloyl-ACP methyl ester carboxylesterase
MAHDALAFFDAVHIARADLLGFSISSFVAQEIALIRPDVVRRLVLPSRAPRGAAGTHGWIQEVLEAVGSPTRPRPRATCVSSSPRWTPVGVPAARPWAACRRGRRIGTRPRRGNTAHRSDRDYGHASPDVSAEAMATLGAVLDHRG